MGSSMEIKNAQSSVIDRSSDAMRVLWDQRAGSWLGKPDEQDAESLERGIGE